MPKILNAAAAVAGLAFAATGVTQARGNFDRGGFAPDYYHQAPQAQHHYTMRHDGGPKSPMRPAVD